MTGQRIPLAAECEHGLSAAMEVIEALGQAQDAQTRVTLLADAIGELIDLDLGWERMAPTLARLQGFAAGLVPLLGQSLGAATQPRDGALRAPCALLQGLGGSL